ncbi:MAG TPA: UDP-N-acetylmuramoyl-tripeptide--D-alanyl-D-alanine ligase [Eubacteriales bacterium]|nr:UDP-N-acetylmuramoyl-tripeptide--D-alanyl-D-alanine ligase [Eubacteriales bacterium]
MFLKIIIAILTAISVSIGSFHTVWRLQNSNYTLRDFFALSYKYYILCLILGGTAFAVWILGLEVKLLELSLAIVFLALSMTISHKPPLKLTPRAKRQFAVSFAVIFAAAYFLPAWMCITFAHLLTAVAFILILPFENINNKRYLDKCAKIFERNNNAKIAITGSYAKTSVKNILTTMLKEKYVVAAPSESVNTPLGISKFVNNGGIEGAEICVFEFGARKKGDIDELCRLVKPNGGIITGLAPQHLQTFKTFENIIETKTELLRYLTEKDFCVINAKDSVLIEQTAKCEILPAGGESNVRAEKLSVSEKGSEFDLVLADTVITGCMTKLLGKHNVNNICLAAACAYKLGIEPEKIKKAISNLRTTPHRLEILPSKAGIIIDDSYNGNLVGINAAAEVLALFSQKKYVITQGIVEGGKRAKELNIEVGKILGKVADKAVVIGKNARHIFNGLILSGMDRDSILFAPNVSDAVNLLKDGLSDSVLLFQNDLPI